MSIWCPALLATLAAAAAFAAAGDLDATFDPDGAGALPSGKVITQVTTANDQAFAVTTQTDGKILAGGLARVAAGDDDFLLIRYLSSGALDTSFGTGGVVTTPMGTGIDSARSVLVQPDGKILLGGFGINGTYNQFALARYNANGTLDTSFGTGGKVLTAIGPKNATGSAVALRADGKILLVGSASNGTVDQFALVRYNPNGSLDTSFGSGGIVTTALSSTGDTCRAAALQPDGKIVAAGSAMGGTAADTAVVRYLENGALDTSFSGDGILVTATGTGADSALGVAVQPDGKIALGGLWPNGANPDFLVARVTADGTPDSSFGTGGKVQIDVAGGFDSCTSLAPQANGKLIVSGVARVGSVLDFAAARVNADGSLDTSFGSGGKVTTDLNTTSDTAAGLAVQPDGKIIIAGGAAVTVNVNDTALVRYTGDTVTDVSAPSVLNDGVVTAGALVYIKLKVTDDASGVNRVALTPTCTNCHLEYPLGTPLTGNATSFPLGTGEVTVFAVKDNPALKARVELAATDHSGRQTIADPVVATLTIKNGRRVLSRTFNRIPAIEHYVTFQNGAPGVETARVFVNGKLAINESLTSGETRTWDIERWMKPGKSSIRVSVSGPKGASTVLLIGDASLAGGLSGASLQNSGNRKLSLEFSN